MQTGAGRLLRVGLSTLLSLGVARKKAGKADSDVTLNLALISRVKARAAHNSMRKRLATSCVFLCYCIVQESRRLYYCVVQLDHGTEVLRVGIVQLT